MQKIQIFIIFILLFLEINLSAQINNSNEIVINKVEVINDSLIISFDINTPLAVENAWVEIRTIDGKQIINNTLDNIIWDKVASGKNRKIVWNYAKDDLDLADKDISIKIYATLIDVNQSKVIISNNNQQLNDNQIQNYFNEKEKTNKPRKTAKYPLFRPGLEVSVSYKSPESVKATLTFEYIAKPWWSIHSGIGYQYTIITHSTINNLNIYEKDVTDDYKSIIIPITAELKLNAGRWFRLYGGGGIVNRIVFEEDDDLHVGQGLNRYMLGLKADAGMEIRSIRIGLSIHQDITPYSDINDKMSILSLSFGWRFGGSRAYIRK